MENKKNNNQVWRNAEGQIHRLDGPAVIWPDGTQLWYINNELHRCNGPAAIFVNGYEEWWVEGKRHRIDGPAVIYPNGRTEYWIKGNNITVQVNQWLNMNNKSYPFDLNTQILFKLTFGI